MKIVPGLRFLSRTSDRRCWNLASYHSPHSMTWSWVLSFSFFRGDERRAWPLGWMHRTNTGRILGVRIPWVGVLRFESQRAMWYRDIYMRDQRDRAENRDLRSMIRTLARRRRPIIVDGGKSLH